MTLSLLRRCLAEATGTALLVGIGTGTLVAGARAGGLPLGVVALAWFVAVALPIQAFADVSGAHLNPAVTLGLFAARPGPRRDAIGYLAAQLAGAFVGSLAVALLVGRDDHLGATQPGPAGPAWIVPLEFACTFLLVASVLALASLPRRPSRWALLAPAAVVGGSTYLIGPWTGSSLNPARSIAPAVLSNDFAWLWLYLAATLAGALAAAGLARALRAGRGRAPHPAELEVPPKG